MKILHCPNEEFQNQFTAFSNAINELTTLALMNRVPIPMSRDFYGLNDIILKCKRDRIKNPDPRNERPALRSDLNESAIVPLMCGSSDPSIKRGNLRSMGNPLYSGVDQLHVRDQVVDNVGKQSPQNVPNRMEEFNMSRGEVIDNIGQRSPRSDIYGIDNMNASRVRLLIILVGDLPGIWN